MRQFAVDFQTIMSSFRPTWTYSAAIYVFSRKLKPLIRFEVARKGEVPTNFQAYMRACIATEACIAAGKPRHPPQHQHQRQPQQQPRQQNPNPGRQALPPAQNPTAGQNPSPMEIDGSRGTRGPLNQDERRRRAEHNLCAYYGQPGHLIAKCPRC